jgi:hypothetical protein
LGCDGQVVPPLPPGLIGSASSGITTPDQSAFRRALNSSLVSPIFCERIYYRFC